MNRIYISDCCPVCQGRFEILKSQKDGRYYVVCDECDTVFLTPEDMFNNVNWLTYEESREIGFCDSATIEEINAIGWGKYVEDYRALVRERMREFAEKQAENRAAAQAETYAKSHTENAAEIITFRPAHHTTISSAV